MNVTVSSVAPAASSASAPAVAVAPQTDVLALEPMIVNLAVSLRTRDDVKAGEKEDKDARAFDDFAAALRDTRVTVLSGETSASLLEPDSRETLKKKLDEQYKLHNVDSCVPESYPTEFFVQRG